MATEKRDDELAGVLTREEWQVMLSASDGGFANLDPEAHKPLDRAMTKVERLLAVRSPRLLEQEQQAAADADRLVREQCLHGAEWADAWWRLFGHRLHEVDEDLMQGWFANVSQAAIDGTVSAIREGMLEEEDDRAVE